MEFDLLRRVRWRNLGRAAAAVALVGAVVAWPRLTPPEPQVPGSEPRPLVEGPPPAPRERMAARREREERPRRDPVGRRKRRVAPPKRRQVREARGETR